MSTACVMSEKVVPQHPTSGAEKAGQSALRSTEFLSNEAVFWRTSLKYFREPGMGRRRRRGAVRSDEARTNAWAQHPPRKMRVSAPQKLRGERQAAERAAKVSVRACPAGPTGVPHGLGNLHEAERPVEVALAQERDGRLEQRELCAGGGEQGGGLDVREERGRSCAGALWVAGGGNEAWGR